MFTITAILATLLGALLFYHDSRIRRITGGWSMRENIGGVILTIAVILWCVVFIALLCRIVAWLWVYAP